MSKNKTQVVETPEATESPLEVLIAKLRARASSLDMTKAEALIASIDRTAAAEELQELVRESLFDSVCLADVEAVGNSVQFGVMFIVQTGEQPVLNDDGTPKFQTDKDGNSVLSADGALVPLTEPTKKLIVSVGVAAAKASGATRTVHAGNGKTLASCEEQVYRMRKAGKTWNEVREETGLRPGQTAAWAKGIGIEVFMAEMAVKYPG